ncbi:MAG TPA: FKBP-type peptidyl-prolyl cis-trans isomerase [Candidatus Paceibacterota bacterium]|nr:FKBP-type peptidyl-prolyl cis-trans isomerase [Candidatus Paceibacterota bacterium]
MKPTPTGIAVALALVVVMTYFIFPGLWPFSPAASQGAATAGAQEQATSTQSTSTTTATTMPNDISNQLQVTDETVGTGATAEPGDTVTVNYVGALTNGQVFDASVDHGNSGYTFTLGVGQVIKGWDEGIVGMKVGGKRDLVIPPSLAYGDQAVGNVIPANSTLVFQVELLSVKKPGQ